MKTTIVKPTTAYSTVVTTTKGKPIVSTGYSTKVKTILTTEKVPFTTTIYSKFVQTQTNISCLNMLAEDNVGTITKSSVGQVTKTEDIKSTITSKETKPVVTEKESKTTKVSKALLIPALEYPLTLLQYESKKVSTKVPYTTCVAGPKGYFM